jgi:hypothetical protein
VREIRTLRLTWRELETWPWWNCEPTAQSKERGWKPSTYSARARSRPYRRGAGRKGRKDLARSLPSFKVLEVLCLGEVSPAFWPSKKACWAHQFRYLGVGQQYPLVK